MGILKEGKLQFRWLMSHLQRDRPALLTFLFHALYENNAEIDKHHADPQQRITTAQMREFIRYFLAAGYEFISPHQMNNDLDTSGKYVLISFDDGYFNNMRMLPILDEFSIPGVFFITTSNIQRNECFWWDVCYRERHRQGWDKAAISAEQKQLKQRPHHKILQHLLENFGGDCLQPWSDTDRLMTPAELQQFARHPLVYIGNHTADHYLLDQYSLAEVTEQIIQGQQGLSTLLNIQPDIIAYPNGSYSTLAVQAAKSSGIKIGLTVDKRKNCLPIDWQADSALTLGRFVLWGDRSITQQCDIFRSDIKF